MAGQASAGTNTRPTALSQMTLRVFGPGMSIMERIRMRAKLSLLGAFLFAPLILVLALHVRDRHNELDYLQNAQLGVTVIGHLVDTVTQIQSHRGLTNRLIAGDTSVTAARADVRAKLEKDLVQLDDAFRGDRFGMQASWATDRDKIKDLLNFGAGSAPQVSFAAHSAAIDRIRQAISIIGERSGLLLDPDADTYFLIDALINHVIPLSESVGQARGLGAGALAKQQVTQTDLGALLSRLDIAEDRKASIAFSLGASSRAGGPTIAAWADADNQVKKFSERARAIFTSTEPQGDSGSYFAAGTEAINAVQKAGEEMRNHLAKTFVARNSAKLQSAILVTSSAMLGVLIVLYLSFAFYISTTVGVRRIQESMEAVANGDITRHTRVFGNDELAALSGATEEMTENISRIVADVRSSASMVSTTGQQLAEDNQALSGRTEEQAASLEQSSAAMRSVAETVSQNSIALSETSSSAVALTKSAAASADQVRQSASAMSELQKFASRMEEIVSTIDAIAFQINVLSLNAAVEAARAGSAGRGFAVVASEIRALADQSQKASQEIRSLISNSTERIADSAKIFSQVEQTMSVLVGGIQDVCTRITKVNDESAGQSAALEQVVQSIGSLDELTVQNAQLVVESSKRSDKLLTRAQVLSKAVANIRLRQGTADEARDLVRSAKKLVDSVGQQSAFTKLMDPAGGFIDRDLYIFAFDRDGIFRVFGANRANVGKAVTELPGLDGNLLYNKGWEVASQGGGWIDYEIASPLDGKIKPKSSYVIESRGWVLGCGIYRDADIVMEVSTLASTKGAPGAKKSTLAKPRLAVA
jgi:methyl-accepting chemotaxis protein